MLSAQPSSSREGRESSPSLGPGPSTLSSAVGRQHQAPAPPGSAVLLWPGQPWPQGPGAEHQGAPGLGHFCPPLGSRKQPMLPVGLAEVCSDLCSRQAALASFPPNFPTLSPQMNSLHSFSIGFPRDPRDPASPTPPHRILQTACHATPSPRLPRSCLGSSSCCGALSRPACGSAPMDG